jgi:hypothetical protein
MDLYALAARIKNLARQNDASLTPMGEAMCNLYIHVINDFYGFAETIPEPHKTKLIELIKSKEGFCGDVIKLNKRKIK